MYIYSLSLIITHLSEMQGKTEKSNRNTKDSPGVLPWLSFRFCIQSVFFPSAAVQRRIR